VATERPDDVNAIKYLRKVHTKRYLDRVLAGDSDTLAVAVEVAAVGYCPATILKALLVRPMLAAVNCTIAAAIDAVARKTQNISVAGGFHHAKPDEGEGFCVLNDIAAAIMAVRDKFPRVKSIGYIDLDAHMGNGVAHCFINDPSVRMLDFYMHDLYPDDEAARQRIDYSVAVDNADSTEYLSLLRSALCVCATDIRPDFVVVTAGQDVLAEDPLTTLQLDVDAVRMRDECVIRELRLYGIPALFVAGGGYSDNAAKVLGNTAAMLC
jgi:histone deacetylase 11